MKIIDSMKYDGWNNTVRNILTFIKKKSYGTSHTVLLEASANDMSSSIIKPPKLNVDIVRVYEIPNRNVLNLSISRLSSWMDEGAHLYLAKYNGLVIGYTVIHLNKYTVDGVGVLDLESIDALWVGPTFVDKEYRSQGINKNLINFTASMYANQKKVVLTSANINNVNSIQSFLKNGFNIKDIFTCRYLLGGQKYSRLVNNE